MITVKERELIVRLHQQQKNQQEIADLIGCSQPTAHRWITRFKRGKTLDTLPRSGRPTKLTTKILSRLKKKIVAKIEATNDEFCSVSTKEIRKIVDEEVGELYSLRHVERIMHKLGFSLITPRPQHVRHDQEKVDKFRDEFKKNLRRSIWAVNS